MRNRGVGSWIARRARMSPGRVALRFEGRSWTYAELAADVSRMALALAELGVHPHDRVGYLGNNHPAFLQAFFASGLLGAVFVPLNPGLATPELVHIVRDAGCGVVLFGPGSGEKAASVVAQAGVREPASVTGEGVGRALGDLVTAPRGAEIDLPVGPDDLCMLVYTSGTTGRPKGVMLTHGNVAWNALNYLSVADFLSTDVTLCIAPLYRAGGWGVTLLPTLHKGGTVVLVAAFDAGEALSSIAAHRVTTLFGGPALLDELVRSPAWPAADLSSLRWVISGGDIVHESLIRAYQQRGVPFLQGYGLTEAGPMALMLDEAGALKKPGSAGVPPLHVDVRIVRPDLSDAAPGEVGEILVSGPNVMRGYWRRPEETEAALVDGWLRTGDAGRMDDDGHVYIVDRLKDMYVSRGENVYPAEVERVLAEHPAVEAAAVVAVDGDAGRAGAAYVVVAAGATITPDHLLAHCRERLAAYKVPTHVVFVETLPRNPAGKVLKDRLEPG